MLVLRLPPHQLRVLVAIAASWRVRGCGPTSGEIMRLLGTGPNNAVINLCCYGLVTQEWSRGRRVPRTLRPTERAWAEINEMVPEWKPAAAE